MLVPKESSSANVLMGKTGQVAPPGGKPKVTAVLWEDEGVLCFQVQPKQIYVTRREDNHFINATRMLDSTGMTSDNRDAVLAMEKVCHIVTDAPENLRGVWIPFERALYLANMWEITDELYPLFVHNIGGLLYNPEAHARVGQPVEPRCPSPELTQGQMSDYEWQLHCLERQNMKRLMMSQQQPQIEEDGKTLQANNCRL